MECSYVIEARNLTKKYKKFTLDIDHLSVPKGFATALIGENGAGKLLPASVDHRTGWESR